MRILVETLPHHFSFTSAITKKGLLSASSLKGLTGVTVGILENRNRIFGFLNKIGAIANKVATIANEVAANTNEVAAIANEVAAIANEVATIANEVAGDLDGFPGNYRLLNRECIK